MNLDRIRLEIINLRISINTVKSDLKIYKHRCDYNGKIKCERKLQELNEKLSFYEDKYPEYFI